MIRSNVDVLADPAWQCGCIADVMICNVDYKELKCLRKTAPIYVGKQLHDFF